MLCADGSPGRRLAVTGFLAAALVVSQAQPTMARTAGPTVAQAAGAPADRPITLRGTVVSVDSAELHMTTAAGAETVRLVAPLMVTGAVRASLADIGPGTFVGTAARAQGDGTFRALEVHIFPETMRGTGEGHRPMEAPGTTMTNASVDAVVQRADGPLLTLRHKDGVTKV